MRLNPSTTGANWSNSALPNMPGCPELITVVRSNYSGEMKLGYVNQAVTSVSDGCVPCHSRWDDKHTV